MKIIIVDGHDGTGKNLMVRQLIRKIKMINKSYIRYDTCSSREKKTIESIVECINNNRDRDYLIIDRWILSKLVYDSMDDHNDININGVAGLLSMFDSMLVWCDTRTRSNAKHGMSNQKWNRTNKYFKQMYEWYPLNKCRINLKKKALRGAKSERLASDVILRLEFVDI